MNARLECGADRCERAEHAPVESQAILDNVNICCWYPPAATDVHQSNCSAGRAGFMESLADP